MRVELLLGRIGVTTAKVRAHEREALGLHHQGERQPICGGLLLRAADGRSIVDRRGRGDLGYARLRPIAKRFTPADS